MSTSLDIYGSPKLYIRYIVVELVLTPPDNLPVGPNEKPKPPKVTIFPTTGTNTIALFCYGQPGYLTAEISIVKASGIENTTASITVYGIDIDTINAFSRLNPVNGTNLFDNLVNVYAGYTIDSEGFPPLIYSGPVRMAGPDYNNPSRPFTVISMIGLITQNTYVLATNPVGTIPLNTLFQSILLKDKTITYTYQPNNVNGYTKDVIYTGSVRQQMFNAASQHGYKVFFDNSTVYVAPIGQPYNTQLFDLNVNTGMLGYPKVDELGLSVRMRPNNAIGFGQQIKLDSFNYIANGVWYINAMTYTLQNRGPKFEIELKLNNYLFNTTPPGE